MHGECSCRPSTQAPPLQRGYSKANSACVPTITMLRSQEPSAHAWLEVEAAVYRRDREKVETDLERREGEVWGEDEGERRVRAV